jgi:4-alpha-glucanotransferase
MSSLPGEFGIGTMGKEARQWIDFLAAAGQHYWQLLPIGPTGYGDSPYQSVSAFAGNPYFIDPELLVKQGLLMPEELDSFRIETKGTAYAKLYETRPKMLSLAVARMDLSKGSAFDQFVQEQQWWLDDYALFSAIKEAQGMKSMHEWPKDLRTHEPKACEEAAVQLKDRVRYYKAVQFLFAGQFRTLKQYAAEKKIKLIGDIPIYVSPDSSDLWAGAPLFQLDEDKRMKQIAGCPPDAYAADGQKWGNPLYDWDYHEKTGFAWWLKRLHHAGTIYDVVRIDHFRGLESYYSIPAGEDTARNGVWKKGPDQKLVAAMKNNLPELSIIAEDLGYVTKEVMSLLAFGNYPGMKILQFAFDSREEGDYMPEHYTKNSVVYTGTHDNTTTLGWLDDASRQDVQAAYDYLGISQKDDFVKAMIRTAMNSKSDTCIIPIQDWLRLGSEARMNTPGTTSGNWQWRLPNGYRSEQLVSEMLELTREGNRITF